MWRVVDAEGHCKHRRGRVSTVKTRRHRYGSVTIDDTRCGNGTFVLRRARSGGRWRKVGAGSDWGNPDRCAADVRRIPLSVLRDLFSPDICAQR